MPTPPARPSRLAEAARQARQQLCALRLADDNDDDDINHNHNHDNEDSSLSECGRAALALLSSHPAVCCKLAHQKLHDVPYRKVKRCWRRLHVDASLWQVVRLIEANDVEAEAKENVVDQVVRLLDMTLILSGAPGREDLVALLFAALKDSVSYCCTEEGGSDGECSSEQRAAKRRRMTESKRRERSCPFSSSSSSSSPSPPPPPSRLPSQFPTDLTGLVFAKQHAIPRVENLSLASFQKRMDDVTQHTPLIIHGAVDHWPALAERSWSRPHYLLEQTLGGRRLVPIEIGESYTKAGWQQKIVTFKEFMETYMLPAPAPPDHDTPSPEPSRTGYLAQHDLFAQIPALRADITIPDYCYCDPAPNPRDLSSDVRPVPPPPPPKLEEPLLHAWFGPAGTISPLHTDPYHNILVQVVGYKYVRLYPPHQTPNLYPRSQDEDGIDMSNTSLVHLDDAMRVWPDISCWHQNHHHQQPTTTGYQEEEEDIRSESESESDSDSLSHHFPRFRHATYLQAVLAPGECLYLPVGWWHYVRSLTPSCNVSFWFN